MKVDLEKVELNFNPLTEEIFVGRLVPNKNEWKHKKNVTNQFLDCVIKRWENKSETLSCGSHSWEVTVRKIKSKSL